MNPRSFRLWILGLVLAACGGASQSSQQAVALPQQTPGASSGPALALEQPHGKSERGAAVPIVDDDPVWGSRTAPVTIVEFSDFQCPFCQRAFVTIGKLQEAYGDRRLRLVFKNDPLPFHPNAKPAAEAAATVRALGGDRAFWTFYGLAFNHQSDLGTASYEAWAQQAGVPVSAFREALATHKYAAKVDEDEALAQKLGVNGTPAFFVNGVLISGAQPFEKFRDVIDEQMKNAEAKLAKGVAAEDVYVIATNENFVKPTERKEDEPTEDTKTVWKVPVDASPQRGNKGALVTIIEFADFQCPYCKRVEPTLEQIKTTYGNDVRFVFRHEPLPFHPRAEPAAELALEARAQKGDTGFWAAHDKLFDSQPKLDDADLERIATELKLDVGKVKLAIAQKKWASAIDRDEAVADDFQASGTPHFFINGRRLVGAQPFEKFKGIIDEEIVKARALVTAGTKADKVYDELTKSGKTPPAPEQKTVTFTGTAPFRGPAGAPVTIVEFADFQCPFCKRADTTLADLLKAYPTKVKLVWRHMPLSFHQQAELAAEASVEVFKQKGGSAFWSMHDQLFAHQSDTDGLARTNIDNYARALGVDMTQFARALDTGANASTVDGDAKVAKNAGINGTPTFLIGRGTPTGSWTAYSLNGAQPLSKFKKLVELALGAHAPEQKTVGAHP